MPEIIEEYTHHNFVVFFATSNSIFPALPRKAKRRRVVKLGA
jgi:hypothetical protein